ncbi:MCE family protein [Mycobacterium sp. 3519A]|uniref:MCE family protein n=1 Tax=Mycobacterium sp. 3519A TaxID=2057184 RepID=UPI000C7D67FC|nr:MlaD family protein [Mycobacterium sp. 3519A]
MYLTAKIKVKLAAFAAVSVAFLAVLAFGYADLPAHWFGIGRYEVTLDLGQSAGLYSGSVVNYRGSQVGRVTDVSLTSAGVQAKLSLTSGIPIPVDLRAEVHSVTALGEQYVELLPGSDDPVSLKDGDVIAVDQTSVPADINTLLESTNRGLEAIPEDNLSTVIDESYAAVGGLGPELSRIVDGSTKLAIDASRNLDPLVTLIEQAKPILDSQADSSDDIAAWANHLADVSGQLAEHDASVSAVLDHAPGALDEGRALFGRVQPTIETLLANLVSVGQVAVDYHSSLEQSLVLLPQNVAELQGILLPNLNTKQAYKGVYLDLGLNLNLPPVCSTGFLPPQQRRSSAMVDSPDRPAGDLYCRVPQDSPFNVRGARNYPCQTRPGKRAPTVKLCESDESYVPLNDGYNWKGDPNATLSGQDVPQRAPGALPEGPDAQQGSNPAPTAADIDPGATDYVAPDGTVHSRSDMPGTAKSGQTWQQMLLPPTG